MTLPKRLWRARDGASVIEFAILAAPFFTVLLSILEASMIMFASANLETGMSDVARRIRTGEVQTTNLTSTDLEDIVCASVEAFLTCDGKLDLDVRTFANFSSVSDTSPVNEDGDYDFTPQFQPGSASQIVLVQGFYRYQVMTPIVGKLFSNINGGERLIAVSFAFRNEPY